MFRARRIRLVQLVRTIWRDTHVIPRFEETILQHGAEHTTDHVVDLGISECVQVRIREPDLCVKRGVAGHLLIDTIHGREGVQCPPVALDPALKAHVLLQILQQDVRTATGMLAVHIVVRAHEAGSASLDGSLERWVVDLPQGARVGDAVDRVSVRLLIVQHKMLGDREHVLRLHAFDIRLGHTGSEVRRLARDILSVAATECNSVHVEAWAEDNVRSLDLELLAQSDGPTLSASLAP
mmetsp:Transcript_157642/g.502247  ORF Transcript_157642/g.502247 Transcript_157642/m.502247 type:complete len:238 (-) Transcript_157642:674-1387(-)